MMRNQLTQRQETLKTERQLLLSGPHTAEQLVAEARGTIDQKEGHPQGLQVRFHILI